MAASSIPLFQLPQPQTRHLVTIKLATGELVERDSSEVVKIPRGLPAPLEEFIPPEENSKGAA